MIGFYRDNYTAGNFVLGLAGGYPAGFETNVSDQFLLKLRIAQGGSV